jgi:hypothetical protein
MGPLMAGQPSTKTNWIWVKKLKGTELKKLFSSELEACFRPKTSEQIRAPGEGANVANVAE